MPIKLRGRPHAGPIRINITENGFRSWAIHLGIATYNVTRGQLTINLPGWFYWQSSTKEQRARARRRAESGGQR